MKLIKMIGLAAIAALAAMAFVGASSASATSTALCGPTDPGAGNCATPRTHIHEVDPAALLLNDITGYVECIGLFLSTSVLGAGLGNPLHILGNFSYSSCEDEGGTACVATELNGPSLIKVLKTATELAAITGEGEVLVRCGFFIHCVYNGENLAGTGEGALHKGAGPNGLSRTHNAVVNRVSGLCPATSELDALYAPLTATYIRS